MNRPPAPRARPPHRPRPPPYGRRRPPARRRPATGPPGQAPGAEDGGTSADAVRARRAAQHRHRQPHLADRLGRRHRHRRLSRGPRTGAGREHLAAGRQLLGRPRMGPHRLHRRRLGPLPDRRLHHHLRRPRHAHHAGRVHLRRLRGMDFYDVSMVDGRTCRCTSTSPHRQQRPADPRGCYRGCTRAISCPAAMRATPADGRGCKRPCTAFDGHLPAAAATGRAGSNACRQVAGRLHPGLQEGRAYAYSYAFDDAATMACKGACDYRVTFGTS